MAEAVLDWQTIFAAIESELRAVTNTAGETAFLDVIQGEPMGLPIGGPYACFWYLGRTDSMSGNETYGNVMYAARVQVACLWPMQAERVTIGDWEADMATVDTNIRRAFRANSTINSNLTDLDISDSSLDYGTLPASAGKAGIYRVLMFELRLDNLEGEAISA